MQVLNVGWPVGSFDRNRLSRFTTWRNLITHLAKVAVHYSRHPFICELWSWCRNTRWSWSIRAYLIMTEVFVMSCGTIENTLVHHPNELCVRSSKPFFDSEAYESELAQSRIPVDIARAPSKSFQCRITCDTNPGNHRTGRAAPGTRQGS